MDLSNLRNVSELITPKGYLRLLTTLQWALSNLPELDLDFVDTQSHRPPISEREILPLGMSQKQGLRQHLQPTKIKENPYSNKSFKDSGFDPYGGFFKTPQATMHNAYKEIYTDTGTVKIDSEFVNLQCNLYAHYKISEIDIKEMIAGYLTATKLLKKPFGTGPNVIAAINGLKIALMPDLKLAANYEGTDSFGLYHYEGKLDYILLSSNIAKEVIDDFNEQTRLKLWEYKDKVASLSSDKIRVMLITITLLHEIGHRVEKKCLQTQQAALHNFWTKHFKKSPISKYGVINQKEWFAECWTAWVVDGLTYSSEVRADFTKLLFPQTSTLSSLGIVSPEGEKLNLKNIFSKSNVKNNDKFKLSIEYNVGPSLEIEGSLIKINDNEIPSIKYKDKLGPKTLNFFPNRKIVKIECGRL